MTARETRYISVADTAKLVRVALKRDFPAIKFSVTSKSYAGGASIRVVYIDGPRTADVEKITRQFEGSTFDGMIDLKSYHSNMLNGEEVHFGADSVHVEHKHSVALVTKVAQAYCNRYSVEMPEILESCGSGYIGWTASNRDLRDTIMPLVYDCGEDDLEGLTICISRGRFAIKRADTEEDPTFSTEAVLDERIPPC